MDINNEFPAEYRDDHSKAASMAASYPPEWYDWAADFSDWHAQVQRADLTIAAARAGGMPEWMIGRLLEDPSYFALRMRTGARMLREATKSCSVQASDLSLPAWAYYRWW